MRIPIGRSRLMLGYLLVAHACALSLAVYTLPLGLAVITAVALLISLIHECRRWQWLPGGHAVTAVEITEAGLWVLYRSGAGAGPPLQAVASVVMPYFITVQLRDAQGKRCHVLLAVDAVNAGNWRRLRLILRDATTWAR